MQSLLARLAARKFPCIFLTAFVGLFPVTDIPWVTPKTECLAPEREVLNRALKSGLLVAGATRAGIWEAPDHPREFADLRTNVSRLIPDIAVTYAMAGCWTEAEATLGHVGRDEILEEANAHLAIEMALADKIGEALTVAGTLRNIGAREQAIYGITRELIRRGELQRARDLIMQLDMTSRRLYSPLYELVRYNLEFGNIEEATRLASGWSGQHAQTSWLLIAEAHLRNRDLPRAKRAFRFAEREGRPDPIWIAQILAENRYFDEARAAARRAKGIDRIQAAIAVAVPEHSHGSKEASRRLLADAERTTGRLNSEDKRTAKSFIAAAYARIGDTTNAIRVAQSPAPDDEHQTSTTVALQEVIAARAEADDIAGALATRNLLPELFRKDMLNHIAIAIARKGDLDRTLELTRSVDNEFLRYEIFVAASALLPKTYDPKDWLNEISQFTNADMQAGSTQALMAALVRNGRTREAMSWIEAHANGLTQARGFLGMGQGMLNMVPGANWLRQSNFRLK